MSTLLLERWMDMDRLLAGPRGCLEVRSFADKWKVSARTVHRDLRMFRRLGRRTEVLYPDEFADYKVYGQRYVKGVEPLFVDNLPNQRRQG
jgi:predicted DNA-binding transcriptional regulator YafY